MQRQSFHGWQPLLGLASLVFICFLILSPANAYKCEPSRQGLEPSWLPSFGQNSAPLNIYGYAQLVPNRRQSLAELRSELKSLALADLALNIQADVTSSITSQQQFINNSEEQRTEILSAAKTSLTVFDLSLDTFINERTCTAFGRVSFVRRDVPFVISVAEIRRYAKNLNDLELNLREIGKIEELISNLEKAAMSGSTSAKSQLSAFKPELVEIRMRAIEAEADLQLANLPKLNSHPDEQLEFINRFLLNLEMLEAAAPLSKSQLDGRQAAEERKLEINSVIGSEIISVYWDNKNEPLDSALKTFLKENRDSYWRPQGVYDETKFISISSDFKLNRSIIFEANTQTSRKFGIDEVDIQLQMRYLGEGWGTPPRTNSINTKAIGRPIDNDTIADKIKTTIERSL
tara:strand:- start:3458 stop:4669 length:1212 start_codon:yes stop_codon:yes gene_type:complete